MNKSGKLIVLLLITLVFGYLSNILIANEEINFTIAHGTDHINEILSAEKGLDKKEDKDFKDEFTGIDDEVLDEFIEGATDPDFDPQEKRIVKTKKQKEEQKAVKFDESKPKPPIPSGNPWAVGTRYYGTQELPSNMAQFIGKCVVERSGLPQPHEGWLAYLTSTAEMRESPECLVAYRGKDEPKVFIGAWDWSPNKPNPGGFDSTLDISPGVNDRFVNTESVFGVNRDVVKWRIRVYRVGSQWRNLVTLYDFVAGEYEPFYDSGFYTASGDAGVTQWAGAYEDLYVGPLDSWNGKKIGFYDMWKYLDGAWRHINPTNSFFENHDPVTTLTILPGEKIPNYSWLTSPE